MGLIRDLKTLYHLLLKPVRGPDHAARLESFYAGQADSYDDFRRRLLQGRQQLWQAIRAPQDAVWVDLGCGTGSNLELFGDRIRSLRRVYAVDLSPSLLDVARRRVAERGWTNVEIVEADATRFQPAEPQVDVVTCSYSLTMIPDWFAAIDRARDMLAPGGQLGVVDFYVSRKYPEHGLQRHGWWTRTFWPAWFALDNVFLSSEHAVYLHRHFEPLHFEECRAKVPYIPFLRVPYYIFVGRSRKTVTATKLSENG